MPRLVQLLPLLAFFYAIASAGQSGAQEETMESVGPLGIAVFVIVFFGLCGWFFWRIWRNERDRRAEAEGSEQPTP